MLTKYNIVRILPLDGGFAYKFPVDTWNAKHVATLTDLKQCKYFWFEEIESNTIENEYGFQVQKKVLSRSNMFFINGFVETLEDIRVKDLDFALKLEKFGWDTVVQGINNDWYCIFNKEDKLIDVNGNEV